MSVFMSGEPAALRASAANLSSKLRGMVVRETASDGASLQIVLVDQFGEDHVLRVEHDETLGLDGGLYGVAVIRLDGKRIFNT